MIDAYCDGSISRSTLPTYAQSTFADYVGRTVVIIPALDHGVIEMFHENLVMDNGQPNALFAEILAIQRAGYECAQMGTGAFVIHADNEGAIRVAGVPGVLFLPPREFHVADAYLKLMLRRCNYIRNSVVERRKPENLRQQEITRLMNAERLEFKLSDSPLYASFHRKSQPKFWSH